MLGNAARPSPHTLEWNPRLVQILDKECSLESASYGFHAGFHARLPRGGGRMGEEQGLGMKIDGRVVQTIHPRVLALPKMFPQSLPE